MLPTVRQESADLLVDLPRTFCQPSTDLPSTFRDLPPTLRRPSADLHSCSFPASLLPPSSFLSRPSLLPRPPCLPSLLPPCFLPSSFSSFLLPLFSLPRSSLIPPGLLPPSLLPPSFLRPPSSSPCFFCANSASPNRGFHFPPPPLLLPPASSALSALLMPTWLRQTGVLFMLCSWPSWHRQSGVLIAGGLPGQVGLPNSGPRRSPGPMKNGRCSTRVRTLDMASLVMGVVQFGR